ncbi:hypothetical protein H5410_027799 [Solanum commersonii]|uniref:Uncharacterized protein n=1 Tax=Solanum commersonii TaxID=4109 RepID=A0A9J5Z059_SOLCO|nr:hypothetical protein H5410_027799 [Solanum commersonii]
MCHSQPQVSRIGLGNISGGSGVDRAGASKPKTTNDNAFSYLNQDKDKFSNQFFDNPHIIDTVGFVEKTKELFKGHPSFLLSLNPFLPKDYEIILNDEDEKTYFMDQALSFAKKQGYIYITL